MPTDDYIWALIKKKANDKNSFSYMLINREKLKYVEKLIDKNKESIEYRKSELSQLNDKNYEHWQADVKFSKIDSYYESVKILKRDDKKKSKSLATIRDSTDFFTKFTHKSIIYIFEIPESKNKDNSK